MFTVAESGRAAQALAMFASACDRYALVSREMEYDPARPDAPATVTWGEYYAAEHALNAKYYVARKYSPVGADALMDDLMAALGLSEED